MNFVMVANSWSAAHDNPTSKHQIARMLAAKGHRVLWIEGSGMRSPSMRSGSDRSRILKKLYAAFIPPRRVVTPDQGGGGVWAVSPLFMPLPALPVARWANGLLCCLVGVFWSIGLGMRTPVLVVYPPVYAICIRLWPFHTLYHCVDRWDAFAMYDADLMRTLDEQCCRYADVVIASARELLDRCLTYTKDAHLVMHGVDWDHFHQALPIREQGSRPADVPPGPIAGFFGLLSEWIDQELVIMVARQLAAVGGHVVLIGKADVDIASLQKEPNIRILGPKPFSDLPRYAAVFDVGLIPFHVNALTRAVNPIKLREMLAAGCPVVSTALPEVAGCVRADDTLQAVTVTQSSSAFVAAVMEQVKRGGTMDRRAAISELARSETWSAKVDEILGILRDSDQYELRQKQ